MATLLNFWPLQGQPQRGLKPSTGAEPTTLDSCPLISYGTTMQIFIDPMKADVQEESFN